MKWRHNKRNMHENKAVVNYSEAILFIISEFIKTIVFFPAYVHNMQLFNIHAYKTKNYSANSILLKPLFHPQYRPQRTYIIIQYSIPVRV